MTSLYGHGQLLWQRSPSLDSSWLITDLDTDSLQLVCQRLEWFMDGDCGSSMLQWRYRNVNSLILNSLLDKRLLCIRDRELNRRWWRGFSFQLPLVFSQLTDKTQIGMDDRPPVLDILERLLIGHVMVLHKVSYTQRGRAALPSAAVNENLTAPGVDLLDLVGDQVEVDVQLGAHPVLHRDLDGVLLLVGHGGQLQGGVDDVGDAEVEEALGGDGPACREVELVCELAGVGPVILLTTVPDTHHHTQADWEDAPWESEAGEPGLISDWSI